VNRHSLCWLCCGLTLLSTSAYGDWGLDASAGVTYDDNISNSLDADDRKADTAAVIDVSGGVHEQLSGSTGLGLSLLASSDTFAQYTGLSDIGLGARLQMRTKFGLGAQAPWLAVAAQAMYRNFHYDYLDGWRYEAGITAGKQFGERWALRATVRYDATVTTQTPPPLIPTLPGSPYDVYGWNLGVQGTYWLTGADLLSLALNRRTGTVTTVSPPDDEVAEYADRAALNTVFGGPEVAYRIFATTLTTTLTWSHSLGERAAINLLYAYSRSRAPNDLGDYYANVINLSLSYAFY